jgi:Flp pilus assembly protein TadD
VALSTSFSVRRTLRKIPALRSLSSSELERIREQLMEHAYQPGEVIWRTRGPVGFLGFIRSGEIEVEYRIDGVLVRTVRLCTGDPVPPRYQQERSQHISMLARALTEVRLCLIPQARMDQLRNSKKGGRSQPAARNTYSVWMSRIWPLVLLLLILGFAWPDLTGIASGVLYMASDHEAYYPPEDPRSMSLLKYAEQVDPEAAFAYNEEGYRWFQQARLPEAESAFVEAVGRDPANAPALNNMAITHFTQGDLPVAAGYLQQSVVHDPNNAVTRYNLGIILMQRNDLASAIREFRVAGFIDPKAASAQLQQAFLYVQTGDYSNAEQRARAAVQLDPSHPSAHLVLAIALFNQEKYMEALTAISDAVWLERENRVSNFYQALILERLGRYDAALAILHRLLATSTNDEESARISAEIESIQRTLSQLNAVAP